LRYQKRKNIKLVVCPRNKQYTDLVVCAASCQHRFKCKPYLEEISLELLQNYIEQFPDYKIVGEIMPAEKKKATAEKMFWVINDDKTVVEVTEKEIKSNPQDYITKEIWDRPPFRYEVLISLKKIKA